MSSEIHCLICNGGDFDCIAHYITPDMYERAVGVSEAGYRREWIRCKRCHFIQSDFNRDPMILNRLYEEGYRDIAAAWRSGNTEEIFKKVINLPFEQSETKQRVHWLLAALRDLEIAGFFKLATPEKGRALDVGGATGAFAYELQEISEGNWRSTVIDPAHAGTFLARDWNVEYVQKPFERAEFEHEFDLISLVFALEHLNDPDAVLQLALKCLSPNGCVFVEVPDSIVFQRLELDDDIFNSCHLWMFEPATLSSLIERNGFVTSALRRYRTARGHYSLSVIGTVA